MKLNADAASLMEYIQKHWFKLLLVLLALYLFTQKDFSFSINMSDPSESQELPLDQPKGQQATQKKQYFTDQKPTKTSLLDRFDLSPFGKSSKNIAAIKLLESVPQAQKEEYLKRFAKVVVDERKKFGIPSSILLGTAYLHSIAGREAWTKNANNHFALQCTYDWKGEMHQQEGNCYRKYESAWMSFRDNSLLLTTGEYASLRSLGSTDYKAWANQLDKMGYSPLDNFAAQLIHIIEHYGLSALDNS